MGETVVFKTGFSRYFPIVCAVVVAVLSIVIAAEDASELVRSVPLLVAGAVLVWLLFGYPRVEVSDGGITLVNVVRTVHVPWPCFTGADARWNLRVDTTAGSYTSWALPAGSGTARRLPKRRHDPSPTQRQLMGNTAEAAALLIGERVRALKDAGHLGEATIGVVDVERRANPVTAVGAAITAGLLALGILA